MSDYRVTYPVAIAIACALAFGVVLFAFAVARAFGRDQDLVTPAIDRGEQDKAHPVGPGAFSPDLDWPIYPHRQARADLSRLKACLGRLNDRTWRRRRYFGGGGTWWILVPVPVVVMALLGVARLTCWFCFAVYAIIHQLLSVGSFVLLAPASAVLRGTERARRDRKLTQATCTRCFHVTAWPAFECASCGQRHHDVLPGRLGLVTRRCECGAHLPTRASRTAWAVTARCQRCDAELAPGSGAVRDVRVPVFGDVSAGKTRFLYASLNSLMTTVRADGRDVTFPDDTSRGMAEFGLNVIRSGEETAKTSTTGQLTVTGRIGEGKRSELIHLFDAAGENFRGIREAGTLRFLDEGHGLVYVLDPFSIRSVADQLGDDTDGALARARAAAGDPELTYDNVVARLRDSGVPASIQILAVVVSKADLLRSAGLDVPAESAAIAGWLKDAGVHNLVMAARHEFAEVRFFTVASQDIAPGRPDDPGAPLRWLLRAHGVRLPAAPDPAASGPRRSADMDKKASGEPVEARLWPRQRRLQRRRQRRRRAAGRRRMSSRTGRSRWRSRHCCCSCSVSAWRATGRPPPCTG
jgi:hypothetical protein